MDDSSSTLHTAAEHSDAHGPHGLAKCPRCGYDLRGIVKTWTDSCPTEGQCAECGLSFSWNHVLRPDRLAPNWCVEFCAPSGSPWPHIRLLIGVVLTWARSLWPWHFWKRMNMAFAIRWRRIALYLLAGVLIVPIGAAVTRIGIALWVRWKWEQAITTQQAGLAGTLAQLQAMVAKGPRKLKPHGEYSWLLPSTEISIEAYRFASIRRAMLVTQAYQTQSMQIEHSYWSAAWEALARPLANRSTGVITYPGFSDQSNVISTQIDPYPTAPAELFEAFQNQPWQFAFGAAPGRTSDDAKFLRDMTTIADIAMSLTVVWMVFPLSLALLPVTRRKAKVRWPHIARVAAYSLALPITLLTLASAIWLTLMLMDQFSRRFDDQMGIAMMTAMLVGGACWWWAAIRNYLRMRHALATTLLLGLLSILLTGGTAFWLSRWLA